MDFFTVPTLTFGILYCFFVIGHDRRRILHFNVTRNPNALWVTLQLHETWEYDQQPQRFLIFDRDSKFGDDSRLDRESHGQPSRFAPHSAVLGRTELRSAGLAVYVEISWIM